MEATRRIRALPGGHDVKVVVLSASVFNEDRAQVLAAGVDDFLPKPIQFGKIYECVMNHLGARFLHEEPQPAIAAEGGTLDRAALAALPSTLRTELADALISLESERIAEIVGRVAELDPVLGGILGQHAGQLKYTAILLALEASG